MPYLTDSARDAALNYIKDIADAGTLSLYLCSDDAATYTQATVTYKLGLATGISVGAPQAGDVSGRKIVVGAVYDIAVSTGGTASHIALVDEDADELVFTGELTASQVVSAGNPVELAPFDIEFPDLA